MPWTASGAMGFGARHNHKLTAAQSGRAALQANAILKKTGDEGLAVATANKRFQHRDIGGTTNTDNPVPTTANQSPMHQQVMSNFDSMTPEQLQEAAMRLKGSPQGQVAQQILARKRIMSANPGQATGAPTQYALGGTLQAKGGLRIQEHAAPAPHGLLHTAGPGRTDNLKIQPHADSYVLPADVISGIGEGNTLAGAKQMDMALHSGPGGIQMPKAGGKMLKAPTPPKINSGFGANPGMAKGFGLARGGPPHKVDIIAAGGEYVVSPEKCAEIGGGDVKRGHKILDDFVLHVRKMTIRDMSKLKGPVKA